MPAGSCQRATGTRSPSCSSPACSSSTSCRARAGSMAATDFLARAVDDCLVRRRPLHRDLLRPLFFGALNRPLAQRGGDCAAIRQAFPSSTADCSSRTCSSGAGRWTSRRRRGAMRSTALFEAFHFTTREGDGSVVAPDMLGRVFEGLMDPEQRHRSGTYYTPASLVQRLVDFALTVHGEHSGVPLADVTMLDPAVGSGAFLLGALERVAQLTRQPRRDAPRRRGDACSPATSLASTSIPPRCGSPSFGSGSPSSPTTTPPIPSAVPPLPNLDAVVRQGDTLWSRQGLHRPDADAGGRTAPRTPRRRSPPPGGAQATRPARASARRGIRRGVVTGSGPSRRWRRGSRSCWSTRAARRCSASRAAWRGRRRARLARRADAASRTARMRGDGSRATAAFPPSTIRCTSPT